MVVVGLDRTGIGKGLIDSLLYFEDHLALPVWTSSNEAAAGSCSVGAQHSIWGLYHGLEMSGY